MISDTPPDTTPPTTTDCQATLSCHEGDCADQDFVWRGIKDEDENYCDAEGLSITDEIEECSTLLRPTFAKDEWSVTKVSAQCFIVRDYSYKVAEYCKCTRSESKSTLSTGVIIVITIGILLFVCMVGTFIYNQPRTTGKQLLQ